MDCRKFKSLISDNSVGLLEKSAKSEFDAHFDSCPACRAASEKFDRVMSMMNSLPAMEPPVGLWNGVRNQIEAAPVRKNIIERIRGLFAARRLEWSAGFAALVLVVALVTSRMQPPPHVEYASGEYQAGHAAFASQDFLADQAALTSAVVMADREVSGMHAE